PKNNKAAGTRHPPRSRGILFPACPLSLRTSRLMLRFGFLPGQRNRAAALAVRVVPEVHFLLARPPREEGPAVVHERRKANLTHYNVNKSNAESVHLSTGFLKFGLAVPNLLVKLVAARPLRPGKVAAMAVQPILLRVHLPELVSLLQDVGDNTP